MSDPQDLLYTNNFITDTKNILNENSLREETKFYNRYTNYINKKSENDYLKYIEDDEFEESNINLNKTLKTKWPVNETKNQYPLFDTYINDISTDRYKKEIITKVNIDSNNRYIGQYLNPNQFSMPFHRTFNNIKKIILNDLNFININQSITNRNNNLAWQYSSENFLVTNNIDTTIIPVPGKKSISYSSLPNSTFSYTTTLGDSYVVNIDNYLVYQTNITPAFYNIKTLINNIKLSTSSILHGQNAEKDGIYVVEQPYLANPGRIGNPHLFSTYIDPVSSTVRFVNRIEELNIVAIQTFSPYETNFQNVDIFYNFSSQYVSSSGNYKLNTDYIYITVLASSDSSYQFYNNLYNLNLENAFPLVITDLEVNVGNINCELLNFTPFFDINIYLNNGYIESELNSISYYKYIDTITITNSTTINGNIIVTNNVYLRFGLRISNGMINGNGYNINGIPIIPCYTNNFIFLNSLNNYYINLNLYIDYEFINSKSNIGRSLLFRWIYDKFNGNYINYEIETLNEKKRTLLHTLAWSIPNETYQIYSVDTNCGFNFIHTNYHTNLISKNQITTYENKTNNYPNIYLNLQKFSNDYYFVNNSYIYIKIYFNNLVNTNTINHFISGTSDESLQYNQVYINSKYFNVGIGEDYTNINNCKNINAITKDQTGIFAKILLSNVPGNYDIKTSNIINNNSYVINYDYVQDNINSISIELYDPEFRLLEITNNFSFTLNIHEIHDVLKETLINTKTNNVSSTGNFI